MQEEFAVIRLLTDFSRISETRCLVGKPLHFLTHLHVYPFQRCFDVFLFAFFLYIYKDTLGFIQTMLHNKQLRYNLVLQAACLVIFVSTPPHFFQGSSSQDALWVHGDEHLHSVYKDLWKVFFIITGCCFSSLLITLNSYIKICLFNAIFY